MENRVRYCAVCKQPIETERAESYSETRLCAAHGREIEKYGGEFKMSASDERTSKSGSFKINYGGGIAITSVRNQEAIDRLRDDYLAQHS